MPLLRREESVGLSLVRVRSNQSMLTFTISRLLSPDPALSADGIIPGSFFLHERLFQKQLLPLGPDSGHLRHRPRRLRLRRPSPPPPPSPTVASSSSTQSPSPQAIHFIPLSSRVPPGSSSRFHNSPPGSSGCTPAGFIDSLPGFIHANGNGTDFMSQYLVSSASLRCSLWAPVCPFGGAFSARLFHSLRSGRCFVYPCGECPARPVPQDTPSVGPLRPDPEVDISTSRLHLRHGVRLETSHPLLLSREDVLDLHCLCHLAVPTFHLLGILAGFPKSNRGYIGVAPATWGLAEDLTPSFCLWGTPWLCIPPDSGRNPS